MRLVKWGYVIVVHFALVVAVGLLILAIQMVRADRRMPGSRLAATYINNSGSWHHIVKHDGRDPIIEIRERTLGVDNVIVSLPDSELVWRFVRDEGEPWSAYVSRYPTSEVASDYLSDPRPLLDIIDGSTTNAMDGVPDAVFTYTDYGIRFETLSEGNREIVDEPQWKEIPPDAIPAWVSGG